CRDNEVRRARHLDGGRGRGDGRGDPLLELLDVEPILLLHGNPPSIRETSLACGLLLRAAVLGGVAVARRVSRVARRELARGEVGVRRRDPLLQLIDLETTLLFFWTQFHDETSFQGLQALKAIESRSPDPSKGSTRCSNQAGNRSKWPVAGVKGMPMPEPTQGSSIPGVSYIATAGPRGSRKTISPPFMIGGTFT